jgi:outer membrane protein OmpA-like peptidoglycan-associated protein
MNPRGLLSCAAALGLLSACADPRPPISPSPRIAQQKATRPAPIVEAAITPVHEAPRSTSALAPSTAPPDVESLPPTAAGAQENLPTLVQFDFDAYQVKEPYRAMLHAHARRLLAEPGLKLLIQARADSRGRRDYNRALASKRADMVKKQLLGYGVPPQRLETAVAEASRRGGGAGTRRVELIYR